MREKMEAIPKKKQIIIGIIMLLLIVIVVFTRLKPYHTFLSQEMNVSPLAMVLGTLDVQSVNDRVNILILGQAGNGADDPNFSQSLALASYDLETNKLTILTIPRNIWSDTIEGTLSAVYSFAETEKTGAGPTLSKIEIGSLLGVQIQYLVQFRFAQVQELVEAVGDLTLSLPYALEDQRYLIPGMEDDECIGEPDFSCRYEEVSFPSGEVSMDAETVVKFLGSELDEESEAETMSSRVRHRLVTEAVFTQLIESFSGADIETISEKYTAISPLFWREFSEEELMSMVRTGVAKGGFEYSVESLPEELFEVPNIWDYGGLYVFLPQDPSLQELQAYVGCAFGEKEGFICEEVGGNLK